MRRDLTVLRIARPQRCGALVVRRLWCSLAGCACALVRVARSPIRDGNSCGCLVALRYGTSDRRGTQVNFRLWRLEQFGASVRQSLNRCGIVLIAKLQIASQFAQSLKALVKIG